MAETVKMQKGETFADIHNDEVSIRNAELNGYHLIKEEPKKEEKKSTKKADK